MANVEGYTRPLADYTVPVNELLDSGIAEVEAFGRNYMRKIFGIPTPAREPAMSIPRILAPQTPPPAQLKRERRDSLTPSMSDDEEQRVHARFLLNLASPEAMSCTPSETSLPARKKFKTRYANTISQSFSQTIRPAYEYMDTNSLEDVRYVQHTYNVPNSPPQSPHAHHPRLRARPGRCARKAQGCNENTKFRPVISDWTCYKNYEPCPKDSQVGWCNKCWCNKGHYSDEDFYRRKFDLLEDQIAVWADEFRVSKFEVWLQIRDGGQGGNVKSIVDPEKARRYVLNWREEWERTGRTPNIKIRPI